MNILVTGDRGFLGSAIIKIAKENNTLFTLGRTLKSDYVFDLSTEVPRFDATFERVIHAAGKAHTVARSKMGKLDFFNVNVQGTSNLLRALEHTGHLPQSFVFISSVAVYGLQQGRGITESTPLLASDPYGLSKIQAEELIQAWCKEHNVKCAILRLPLIAGTNPPGNLRSMILGIDRGYYFNVAGGAARKSIVLATDVASIIPKASEIGGIFNLTDGCHPSFAELSELIADQMLRSRPRNMPKSLALLFATVGNLLGASAPINSRRLHQITSDLTFDDSKARQILGWKPTPVLEGLQIV